LFFWRENHYNYCCHQVRFKALNAPKNSISAGVLSQIPLGSLQRSPKPLARFKGPTSKSKEGRIRKRREGRESGGGNAVPPCTHTFV